ncbi:MAG: BMC domain-containing protein [Clostridia bacterium]|nr:BMC domain-containing protein [Clostridia bacterium]
MNALGLIEVYSFTTALCVADLMAKSADVKVIAFDRNRPFAPDAPAPLIMVVKVEGSVAAVKAAIEAGTEYAENKGRYIVSHIIARPDDSTEKMAYLMDINKDKFNKKFPKTMKGFEAPEAGFGKSIGILEISGFTASVVGLDAMCKAADVRLLHKEERLGGRLVTLVVAGSVSAVKAAIEHGSAAASPVGEVYGTECIASPHSELLKFFDLSILNDPSDEEK